MANVFALLMNFCFDWQGLQPFICWFQKWYSSAT